MTTTRTTMRRVTTKPIPTAALLSLLAVAAGAFGSADRASAAEGALPPIDMSWHHEGIFGTFDRAAAQRGFQVYREVCQGCHALPYVAFRNLMDIGFSEEQARAIAEEYTVVDGPDDDGEMFERPARLSDAIPPPYPNDAAARAANGGAYPPPLSLMTKARPHGDDYVYSLMLGYQEDEEAPPGQYYNAYFPGNLIAMPQPLHEGLVSYTDGTEATIPQMSADVTQFLAWAAEPTLEERKGTGIKTMLFLIVLTGLLYATKRKVWADVH
jgi:ubiquinol-cytochrome c reductase cytochrome c1 subunit